MKNFKLLTIIGLVTGTIIAVGIWFTSMNAKNDFRYYECFFTSSSIKIMKPEGYIFISHIGGMKINPVFGAIRETDSVFNENKLHECGILLKECGLWGFVNDDGKIIATTGAMKKFCVIDMTNEIKEMDLREFFTINKEEK